MHDQLVANMMLVVAGFFVVCSMVHHWCKTEVPKKEKLFTKYGEDASDLTKLSVSTKRRM